MLSVHFEYFTQVSTSYYGLKWSKSLAWWCWWLKATLVIFGQTWILGFWLRPGPNCKIFCTKSFGENFFIVSWFQIYFPDNLLLIGATCSIWICSWSEQQDFQITWDIWFTTKFSNKSKEYKNKYSSGFKFLSGLFVAYEYQLWLSCAKQGQLTDPELGTA